MDPDPAIEIPVSARPGPLCFETLFGDRRPVDVDAGSGKGRFLLARATANPESGLIGIERQRRRIDRVAVRIRRSGLDNVRLAHADIRFTIELMMPDDAVRTFFLFFPDPWPKRRHRVRRLVNAEFLTLLHQKLIPGGCIHFATDHDDYAGAVAPLFSAGPLYSPCPTYIPTEEERTDFELMFAAAGKTPHRFSIRKNGAKPPLQGAPA